MPITITVPPSGGPAGVGFTVSGSTNLVGPIPVDDYWLVQITQSTDLNTVQYGCKRAEGFNTFSVTIGNDVNCQLGLQIGSIGLAQGQTGRLLVELRHANHAIVESLSIPITWDGAAMLWKYGDDHGWGSVSPQAGFTASDRALLTHADDGIWQRFPHA